MRLELSRSATVGLLLNIGIFFLFFLLGYWRNIVLCILGRGGSTRVHVERLVIHGCVRIRGVCGCRLVSCVAFWGVLCYVVETVWSCIASVLARDSSTINRYIEVYSK